MTPEELEVAIEDAIAPAFRGQLIARGQARAMIWRDGTLPEDAPHFSVNLSYDLLSYGYALLSMALRLSEDEGNTTTVRAAYEHAGNALEAVISNGDPNSFERGFHRLFAASAFHLGRFSAKAYSLLKATIDDANISPMERGLALLILRSLDQLETEIVDWTIKGTASDNNLVEMLDSDWDEITESGDDSVDGEAPYLRAIDLSLNENFYGGLGAFLLAIESGEDELVEVARSELRRGIEICEDLNLVPQWWCHRIAIKLLDELWNTSFHTVLPVQPPDGDIEEWAVLRELFIAILNRRARAEIELWPSQLDAAVRAVDASDDLIVSLPTGAGKTRIAELCILRCLSDGKRVFFVTPLRALSAQTETNLLRTFGPLGKSISTLYGSIGTSRFEEDALRTRSIVVATPEKLDFALRNDPSLLNDVGLVVLDEGHMIGLGEREVRYEVQIQRLLKRPDAGQRRIVCLSAILPSGEKLDDFVSWLRKDAEGEAISADWRPTRVRFGEVLWRKNPDGDWKKDRGDLELRVGEEKPFVRSFIRPKLPTRTRRTTPFPKNQRELVLATTWRLVGDGKSVLIYCPQRRSVEPFAVAIVDLHNRGLLETVLTVPEDLLSTALAIGRESLGADHPILACLRLGVATHHGALPTPFRKEIEQLLRDGVLKVTISSPTLAQGLNLSASSVVFFSLDRYSMSKGKTESISVSEFRNVIGRAGRAFIDVEGTVLFPIFDRHGQLRSAWQALIVEANDHDLESGLLRLIVTLLQRLSTALGKPPANELVEYVVNNAWDWRFPEIDDEKEKDKKREHRNWETYLQSLDTAILSLLGDQDIDAKEVAAKLDEVLSSSLWARSLSRRSDELQSLLRGSLAARTGQIWASSTSVQRKGYFLAGVGLTSGHALDGVAPQANEFLVDANAAILNGENERAIAAITSFAELIFAISPFVPDPLPDNWRDVLRGWLLGLAIADFVGEGTNDVLRFVENGLIYRLPWGMEAVRVRALVHSDQVGELSIDNYELSLVVPAVETGTLNRSAAILMQAGFTSRLAAIKAVSDTSAEFETSRQLADWLRSEAVVALTGNDDWPTLETARIWRSFVKTYVPSQAQIWEKHTGRRAVNWLSDDALPLAGSTVKVRHLDDGRTAIMSPSFKMLGQLANAFQSQPIGLMKCKVGADQASVDLEYLGPGDIGGF